METSEKTIVVNARGFGSSSQEETRESFFKFFVQEMQLHGIALNVHFLWWLKYIIMRDEVQVPVNARKIQQYTGWSWWYQQYLLDEFWLNRLKGFEERVWYCFPFIWKGVLQLRGGVRLNPSSSYRLLAWGNMEGSGPRSAILAILLLSLIIPIVWYYGGLEPFVEQLKPGFFNLVSLCGHQEWLAWGVIILAAVVGMMLIQYVTHKLTSWSPITQEASYSIVFSKGMKSCTKADELESEEAKQLFAHWSKKMKEVGSDEKEIAREKELLSLIHTEQWLSIKGMKRLEELVSEHVVLPAFDHRDPTHKQVVNESTFTHSQKLLLSFMVHRLNLRRGSTVYRWLVTGIGQQAYLGEEEKKEWAKRLEVKPSVLQGALHVFCKRHKRDALFLAIQRLKVVRPWPLRFTLFTLNLLWTCVWQVFFHLTVFGGELVIGWCILYYQFKYGPTNPGRMNEFIHTLDTHIPGYYAMKCEILSWLADMGIKEWFLQLFS